MIFKKGFHKLHFVIAYLRKTKEKHENSELQEKKIILQRSSLTLPWEGSENKTYKIIWFQLQISSFVDSGYSITSNLGDDCKQMEKSSSNTIAFFGMSSLSSFHR